MKANYLLIVLALSIITVSAQIETSITIPIDKDATISSRFPDSNFGDSPTINALLYQQKTGYRERTLFQIDLSQIPVGATIISAQLKLKGLSHSGNNQAKISPLPMPWDENTITWNQTKRGGLLNSVLLPQSRSAEEDYIVDITSISNLWMDGTIPNNGLLLDLNEVSLLGTNSIAFASSDHPEEINHPEVEIVYVYDRTLKACDYEMFTLTINEPISSTDMVNIVVDLPDGIIALDSTNINISNATITTDISDPNNPQYTITSINTNLIEFNYWVQVGCDAFSANSYDTLNIESVSLNGNFLAEYESIYGISTPFIELIASSCQNLDYVADYNVPFERIFHYKNSSPEAFTGEFVFTDTLWANSQDAWIRFDNIELLSPASGTVVETIINDSTLVIKISVDHLTEAEPIIIKETLTRISCDNIIPDKSRSNFYAQYGCDDGGLCANAASTIPSVFVAKSGIYPIIRYELLTTGYQNCWSDQMERLIRITNIGTANSDTVLFYFNHSSVDITELDTSNIVFFTRDGSGNETVITDTIRTFNTATNQTVFKIPQGLTVGDSIFFRYYEIVNCIDETNYNSYFNALTRLHEDGFPIVVLQYACPVPGSVNARNADFSKGYTWHINSVRHWFRLNQYYNSLTGTMEENEEAWFEINNLNSLLLGFSHGAGNGFIFNMDSSRIEVKIILTEGLALVGSNLYIESCNPSISDTLHPESIQYIEGSGITGDVGYGDTIIAYFHLDTPFYDEYTYANNRFVHRPTAYYTDFFSNFNVKFQLHAYCAPQFNGGKATMLQEFSFIPNVFCDDSCKVPLSSVENDIIINCPGCRLPGWNLDPFTVNRLNYGYGDDDNNNFPDVIPFENTSADINLAQTHSVIIGDTLEFTVSGITSDGETYRFENIGFDYTYAQFQIQGGILNSLRYIGGEGHYYCAQQGLTSSFSFSNNYSGIETFTDEILFDVSINALHNQGLNNSITRFWGSPSSDSIEVTFRFIVDENLINGATPNAYYSIEGINIFLNMSGTPYISGVTKDDANNESDTELTNTGISGRENLNYWCTAALSRFIGVGTDYYQSLDIQSALPSPCVNNINYLFYTDVGRNTTNQHDFYPDQVAWNSFSFELRNLWMLDSITFTFPPEYEYISSSFANVQLMLDTDNNITIFNGGQVVNTNSFPYEFGDETVTENSVTLHFEENYHRITQWLEDSLTAYDETKRYRVYCNVGVEDFHNTPDTIGSAPYAVQAYWKNFPGTLYGDTVITRSFGNNHFIKPQAEIEGTQAGPFLDVANTDLLWTLDLTSVNPVCNEAYQYEKWRVHAQTENTFVYFKSPSNNITIDEVILDGSSLPIFNTIDGLPLFGIGTLNCSTDAELEIYASYNCENWQLGDKDTLITYYGWNCYQYPDTILADSICFVDSIMSVITPAEAGLITDLYSEDTVSICDTITYTIDLSSTENSAIENIQIRLQENPEYRYLEHSAHIRLNANTEYIEPTMVTADALIWHLDSVDLMQGFNSDAVFVVDIVPNCGFVESSYSLELNVTAYNYCGLQVANVDLSNSPPFIEGLPQLDSLDIDITTSNSSTCFDSILVSIQVANLGNQATGDNNTFDVDLPYPYNYSIGDAYTENNGNIYSFDLPSGIAPASSQSFNFYIRNQANTICNSNLTVEACITPATEYICGEDTCLYSSILAAVCQTATFNIQIPTVEFVNGMEVDFCTNNDTIININMANTSAYDASNLNIDYYCIEDAAACLIHSESIAAIAAQSNQSLSSNIGHWCADCSQIMAVLSGDCICQNDTLLFDLSNATTTLSLSTSTSRTCIDPCNGTATVTATGGDGTYSYIWADGQTTATAVGLCQALYTVTVSDAGGCTAQALVGVQAQGAPTISNIESLNPCLYLGENITFSATTSHADDYLWDFGNGFTSTSQQATYTFTEEGNYTINLIVNNACGSAIHSENFYVLPDNCACDSVDGGTVHYDILHRHSITTNQTWNIHTHPSGELKVEGDLFIEAGQSLTIDGITLRFGPAGKLIVKPTATLILNHGATLTSLEDCGLMWQGVEVWGNAYSIEPQYQGQVRTNSSHTTTIENAHIGLLSGKRNPNYNNYTGIFENSRSGGLIRINHIDFKNNGIGIKVLRKQNRYTSQMSIDDCHFVCTDLLDARYSSNHANAFPTANNPYVYASPLGRTSTAIWAQELKQLVLSNSSFSNIDTCVKVIDNGARLENNSFEQAAYGFYALNTTSNLVLPHSIKYCSFDQIHDAQSGEGKAIYIALGVNDIIHDNEFGNQFSQMNYHDIAIQMDGSHSYEITENDIASYKTAIIAHGSEAAYIGANAPLWEGNTITGCKTGIKSSGQNQNLMLRCNDHTPSVQASQYYLNWKNTGSLADQGQNIPSDVTAPAGNTFNRPAQKEINTNFNLYNYYHHSSTSINSIYRPTMGSFISGYIHIYHVANTQYTSDEAACSYSLLTPPLAPFNLNLQPYAPLESMNSRRAELGTEWQSATEAVDGGQTSALLSAIQGSASGGQLKNLLLQNSPLSEEVLRAVMQEDALSPGNFKLLMQENTPVALSLLEDSNTYIENYPNGIKNQLIGWQNNPAAAASPYGIKRELGQLDTKYYRELDKIVDALLDANSYRLEDAINLLEYDGSIRSKQTLYGTYLAEQRYSEAGEKLVQLSTTEMPDASAYVALNVKILGLQENGQSLQDLSLADRTYIEQLAGQCPETPVVYQARAIHEVLTGEHIGSCPEEDITGSRSALSKGMASSQQSASVLGDNYPDPLTDHTTIPYQLYEVEKARLVITDVLGKSKAVFEITKQNTELKIATATWPNGVYYYSLEIDGEIQKTKTMIINK